MTEKGWRERENAFGKGKKGVESEKRKTTERTSIIQAQYNG